MRAPRIGSYLRIGRRMLVMPMVGLIAGLGVAAITTARLTATFEASASVIVLPSPTGTTDAVRLSDVSLAQNLVSSVAGLAGTSDVAVAVAAALHVPQSDVAGRITGVSQPGIQIVSVQATASTAAGAAAIANAASVAIISLAERLHLGGSAVVIQTLDAADLPGSPVSPRPLLNDALGGLVGLLIGIGFVSLRGRVGGRFRQAADIESALGLPTLAIISRRTPAGRTRSAAKLYSRREIGSFIDGLVSTLSVYARPGSGRTILVTTVDDHAGASFAGALLAVGLQVHQGRTTLVEVTAQRAAVHRFFADSTPDDVQAVLGREPAGAQTARTGSAAGPAILSYPTISAYFDSHPRLEQIAALIDTIAANGDDVVVVAPPVLGGGALVELARRADVLLLSVDIDRVSRGDAGRAGQLVRQLGVPLAGLLVTGSAAEQDGWQMSDWAPQSSASDFENDQRSRSSQRLPGSIFGRVDDTEVHDRPITGRSPNSGVSW